MLVSQKLAIAAHLHVLLRRKTGRVTDTEWMAANLEYALEVIRFARTRAAEDGHPDLGEWASKLEAAMLEPLPVQRALAHAPARLPRERSSMAESPASGFSDSMNGESGFLESTFDPQKPRKLRDPDAPRYVGGIR
jgi:hypothetical protein